MEGSPLLSSAGLKQPLSVDFIKNRLPQIHDAFKDLPVRYDPGMKRFVFDPNVATMPSARELVPARKLVPALRAMTFWNQILDNAMAKFTTDNSEIPKKLAKNLECGIRGLKSWDQIYMKLQQAREKFDSDKSEFWGGAKKAYRHLIDQSDVARQVLKAIPDVDYVSPVKAAVEVLLDAAETTSIVRRAAISGFDENDLEKTFGKIEVFLATFPEDENIKLASVDLIASTLKAIECAIAYFLSHTLERLRRSLPLIGDGNKFQEGLLSSIGQIPVKCQALVSQALDSHIAGTKKAMELVLEGIERVVLLETETGKRVELVIENTEIIQTQNENIVLKVDQSSKEIKEVRKAVEGLTNNMVDLLEQGRKAREEDRRAIEEDRRAIREDRRAIEEERREWREEQRAILKKRAEDASGLEIRIHDSEMATNVTPTSMPQQLHWTPQEQLPWYPFQQYSWQSQPSPQILYSQQQIQIPLAGVPPLPAGYYQPHPLPAGYYQPHPPPELEVHVNTLMEILNMTNLDTDDLASILESAECIALRYRSQAKRIISSDEFHAWATSPTSCELLIQGEPGKDVVQAGPALSLVSASLMNGLHNREGFVSLVFFCGNHIESDDMFAGPHAMIRSLIAQLLRQQFAEFTFRQQDVDLDGLRAGNFDVLCRLFRWLVGQILQHKTLVCVVDAVEAYETSDYETSMREVVQLLLDLTRDPSLVPVVKVLATSPEGTVSLDELFTRKESSVLLVEGLLSRGDEEDALDLPQMS